MYEPKNITLWQMLCETASKYPDNEAAVSLDMRLKYSELITKCEELAGAFLNAGIVKGDHVGLWLNDGPKTVLLMCSLWCIGAVPVPICTDFMQRELEGCIKSADIGYLITDIVHRDNDLLKVCLEQTALAHDRIFTAEESGCEAFASVDSLLRAGSVSQEEIRAAEESVQPSDIDTILFTSGSTGSAKPVLTTHFSRVNTAYAQAAALDTTPQDRFCSVLPMFHCFSLTGTILASLAAGACLCYPPSRKTTEILATVEREHCTVLTAVPTLFSALVRRQKEIAADVSTLRTGMIGGSTYPPEFFCEICDVFGMTLLPSLGQTEATAGISSGLLTDSIELRSTSLGVPFEGTELSIRTDGKALLPDGQVGEICVRGFNVMQGYYNNPQATAHAIGEDGWLHTDDLGYMKDGYLYYSGRLKDIIIRGGENIFPGEIETLLESDERISQTKVIGVPDPHDIEEVCACIVPAEGRSVDADYVRNIVAASLSAYKVPRYVVFFSSFPLMGTGKIDRRTLKSEVTEMLLGSKNATDSAESK